MFGGRFNGGFFALRVWGGLVEGLIFGILRYRTWAIEDHVPRGLAAGLQVRGLFLESPDN